MKLSAITLNNAVNVSRAMEAAFNKNKPTPKAEPPFVIQLTRDELNAVLGSLSQTALDGTIQDALWQGLRKLRDSRLTPEQKASAAKESKLPVGD